MDEQAHHKIVWDSLLLGALQCSIAGVELYPKFSILNSVNDQKTLQRAADSLTTYIFLGSVLAIGTIIILYHEHGMYGAIYGILANVITMTWIVVSYLKAFECVVSMNNHLTMPRLFVGTTYTYKHKS